MLPQLLFGASASMLGCVYGCQAQRTAISAVCCRVGCALVPSDCCAVVSGEQRTVLSSVLVGQSYDLVVMDGSSF